MATEYNKDAFTANSIITKQHFGASTFPCIRDLKEDRTTRFASRRNGQELAGSGALVFEGELLEFPVWN